ncbi:MAG TPA: CvpA family protein [Sedimentisphaerales bacterium]|nr:CvpA family protein [Sedimentisphaerales bacterium]
MVFWIAVLTGALFVWLAVRRGFYESWALLFNVLVSIYISVFLAPTVARFVPMPGGAAWCMALSMLVLAGGTFAILHGLTWVFLTGQFSIRFPSLFDVVCSGILGFVAGFLILSFAALALSTTPLAQHKIVTTLGLGRDGQKANVAGLARGLDLIHTVARFADSDTSHAAITKLLDTSDELAANDESRPEPNEPNPAPPQPQPQEDKGSKPPAGLQRRSIPDPL